MTQIDFQAGSLVRLRNRDWIVLPSLDKDLLLVKPLGGTDEEITGIYRPLMMANELPQEAHFPLPNTDDLSDFATARLLYNASRLSFRNAAGPFRSIGKYSFRPRAYQVVPLIMALRQPIVRLMIADDVGIGKTIEALMIARELLDRGEIKRFAVVCLPHLCEQWQSEIKDKFGIEAEIIRSSTASQLDKKKVGDASVFQYFPFQVISIDYIKSDNRRQMFIHEAPELIIVDEVHTCARPEGAHNAQQQRFKLLHDLSKKEKQHLVLLSATPHSGKDAEFQSLLGLLQPEFEKTNIVNADEKLRKKIAAHFVQRRRKNIEKWGNDETTTFPKRLLFEFNYELGAYDEVFIQALDFAHNLAKEKDVNKLTAQQKFQYFTVLSLLRGIMSSPKTGMLMLRNRAERYQSDEELTWDDDNKKQVFDTDFAIEGDTEPIGLSEKAAFEGADAKTIKGLYDILSNLQGIEKDNKAKETTKIIKKWLDEGFNTIIYCRFIETAKYIGAILKNKLGSNNVGVQTVTSELSDEQRKEAVDVLKDFSKRILVATDCMSEGINLQGQFNAVLHYDLPWNPNRLEQREGRVDRFGQTAPQVNVGLLYSSQNPIDGVVLNVLLKKANAIRHTLGISVPFPEDSSSVMEAVMHAVLLKPKAAQSYVSQMSLFGEDTSDFVSYEKQVEKAYRLAEEREKAIANIFAQHAIKAQDIEIDLKEVDEVIGNVATVEEFFKEAIVRVGGQIKIDKDGYTIYKANISYALQQYFGDKNEMKISFKSPTPEGYRYIGRNHAMTENLCNIILRNALIQADENLKIGRFSAIRSKSVSKVTTLVEFRVRNVIANLRGNEEMVAEEMLLLGYAGSNPADREQWLDLAEAKHLLLNVTASSSLSDQEANERLERAKTQIIDAKTTLDQLALERAQHLVKAHERFRNALDKGHQYKAVEPVLPMDILGIYILLPDLT